MKKDYVSAVVFFLAVCACSFSLFYRLEAFSKYFSYESEIEKIEGHKLLFRDPKVDNSLLMAGSMIETEIQIYHAVNDDSFDSLAEIYINGNNMLRLGENEEANLTLKKGDMIECFLTFEGKNTTTIESSIRSYIILTDKLFKTAWPGQNRIIQLKQGENFIGNIR